MPLIPPWFYGTFEYMTAHMDMTYPPYDEKEYDPSTSERLAEWSPGGLRGETESLYKTAGGNFFILAQAGLLSRPHDFPESSVWFGGTGIRPVSPREAYEWCEETGNYEVMDGPLFYLKPMI